MPDSYNSKVVLASGEVLIDLTSDTVDAAHLIKNYTAHGADGAPIVGACEFDSDTSADTAAVSEILVGKTAHARGTLLNGTMPNNGQVSGVINTKTGTYVIPQGYHDGSGTVGIASTEQDKLIPANIRQGITLLGVEGEMSGSEGMNPQSVTVTPTFSQQVIAPDAQHNCLSEVTVNAITVSYADSPSGGKVVTIGAV